MRIAKFSHLSLLIALIGSFSINAFSIEATTNPVGVIQVTALGDSDTIVSIPLKQPAVFNGVVNSAAGQVLTAEGSPGWSADEWIDAYYGFVRPRAAAGNYAAITTNTENSITLDVEDLTGVAQGDSFSIHPFWTLDLLFPDGAGVNEATSHADRDSEIFIPAFGEGINLAAESTYYYFEGIWQKVGGGLGVDQGSSILLPDSFFVLRNNISSSTTVTFTGEVVMGDLGLPLVFQDASQQDNIIGLQRPIEMSLDESGLVSSGAFEVGDELLIWDNALAQQDRLVADATVYTWDGAKWVKNGGVDDVGGDLLNPGSGFLIRKAASGVGVGGIDWLNNPNYGN